MRKPVTNYVVTFPNLAPHAKQHACIVSISVGGDAHEGEQFRATLKATNDVGFKKCYIMVTGKLQRHTEQIADPNLSEKEAESLALKKEKEWLERNQKTIEEELTIEYEIIFWDRWLNDSNYPEKLKLIEELYKNNESFQTAVDKAATQFNGAFVKQTRVKIFKGQQAQRLSEIYIKEESAVILLWRALLTEARYIIYPLKNTPAHNFIFECLKLISNSMVKEMNCLEFVSFNIKEVRDERKRNDKSSLPVLTLIEGGQSQDQNTQLAKASPSSTQLLYNKHKNKKTPSPPQHEVLSQVVRSVMASDAPTEKIAKVLASMTLELSRESPEPEKMRFENGIN